MWMGEEEERMQLAALLAEGFALGQGRDTARFWLGVRGWA